MGIMTNNTLTEQKLGQPLKIGERQHKAFESTQVQYDCNTKKIKYH